MTELVTFAASGEAHRQQCRKQQQRPATSQGIHRARQDARDDQQGKVGGRHEVPVVAVGDLMLVRRTSWPGGRVGLGDGPLEEVRTPQRKVVAERGPG